MHVDKEHQVHVIHQDPEEILKSWHHICIPSADQETLWMCRRGMPYGPAGDEDDESDASCIYYAQVKRTEDLNHQLAMLMPPPDWLSWKMLGVVVQGGPNSYILDPRTPFGAVFRFGDDAFQIHDVAFQIRNDLTSRNYRALKV